MSKDYFKTYTEIKLIGKGSFGAAHLVKHNEDKKLYVAKKIALSNFTQKDIEATTLEAALLKNLKSPHIVSYKNSYYDNPVLIIVMEYCERNMNTKQ